MNSVSTPSSLAHAVSGGVPALADCSPRWPYLALGFGAALFFYLHLFHYPAVPIWHPGDQSIFFEHAERMLHGEVLYRDLFQFNLPGTEFLYLFLFRVLGIHLWIAPLAMFVTATSVTLLVYALARVVVRGAAALLPAVAYVVICQRDSFDACHHWYSTLLVLMAVNLIARKRSTTWLGVAGALLGLTTLFTSSRGIFVTAGVTVFLFWQFGNLRRALEPITALLVPFFTVLGSALIYLARMAGPRVLFDSVFIFTLRYYSAGAANSFDVFLNEWQYVLPLRPWSIVLIAMWFAVNIAVPAFLIAFIVMRFRRDAPDLRASIRGQALMLYAFAGVFALLAVVRSPFALRLNCAAAFAYVLGAAMLHNLGTRRLFVAAMALLATLGASEVAAAALRPVFVLDGPRGPIAFWHRDDYEYFAWFARNAKPGDELFGDRDVNYVLALRNPSMLEWVEPDAYTRPEQVRDLLIVLQQQQTRFIVWDEEPSGFFGADDSLQPLRAFLRDHYHIAKQLSDGIEVLINDASEPTGQ
jgi:hypothetical protein